MTSRKTLPIGSILPNGDQQLPDGIQPNHRMRGTLTLPKGSTVTYMDKYGKRRSIPHGHVFTCSWRKGSPWEIDIYGLPDASILGVSIASRLLPIGSLALTTTKQTRKRMLTSKSAYLNRLACIKLTIPHGHEKAFDVREIGCTYVDV